MNAAIVGGDIRQVYLYRDLKADGHGVTLYGFELREDVRNCDELKDTLAEAVSKADCVLLPYPSLNERGNINAPFSEKELAPDELFASLAGKKIPVLCGRAVPKLRTAAESAGVELIDYEAREELLVKNAVPSAEGALQIAMEETQITIHGSSALVLGFGRIGKLIAKYLQALGAKVSVSARNPGDLAWIGVYGYTPLETGRLAGKLSGFDMVFNTVPAVILTRGLLAELPERCVIIDIASSPGGVDYPAARALSRRAIHALSLPGKIAPGTAGRAIRDVVYAILKEREESYVGDKGAAQH